MGPILMAFGVVAALAAHQQQGRPVGKVRFGAPQFYLVQPGSKPVATHHPAAPQMLCTMPLIRPKDDVDSKIVIEPDKDLDYKIRVVVPPPCIER